ncbi:MAG: thrombospondin type 3 repeat-containing protein [Candidatus Bathyarchaeia archaeon]
MSKTLFVNRAIIIVIVIVLLGAAFAISYPRITTMHVSSNAQDSPDSDSDGLTDFQEARVYKTDPLNPNTDHDRYSDGQEIFMETNPLVANSAIVEVLKIEEMGEYNTALVARDAMIITIMRSGVGGCSVGSFGECAASSFPQVAMTLDPILDDVIYDTSASIQFSNVGDDYTSSVRYTSGLYIGGEKIKETPGEIGTLEPGEKKNINLSYKLKLRDIPITVWSQVQGNAQIEIKIENVSYEKFPFPLPQGFEEHSTSKL